MSNEFNLEPMLDMFVFETTQLLEQLERIILESEKQSNINDSSINEIFRIMHTIKGSSAMMLYNNISELAHSMEDIFYYLRESKPSNVNYSALSDLIFESVDFIKNEISKIEGGMDSDGDSSFITGKTRNYLEQLKSNNSGALIPTNKAVSEQNKEEQHFYIPPQRTAEGMKKNIYRAVIYYEDGCEMENIRAFSVIHNLKEFASIISHNPSDIIENDKCAEIIRSEGFKILFASEKDPEEVREFFQKVVFLKEIELDIIDYEDEVDSQGDARSNTFYDNDRSGVIQYQDETSTINDDTVKHIKQSIISVNVTKLDRLMDLVGELVISEAMVTRNPDLNGLVMDNFSKAARQLRAITNELQDIVMSIRMVPLTTTFQKMHRIVRDMSKKLNKEVELQIIGEETEVDKNIIEHLSDPLMHLVRNSIDHGIESVSERISRGKPGKGKITLEAKNEGGDVWITVKDDGSGMNREKIYNKAVDAGLTNKTESELTDREIYSFILRPGFSTKERVTEFSGRGVGMDVVASNIEEVGGSIIIDSIPGVGTTMSLKIPLTLAIIDGMQIKVGNSVYTVPVTSIKQSFRPKENDIIVDPDGNEMIMVRGECYPIVRLHRRFNVKTKVSDFTDGIIMMIEGSTKNLCLFADSLLGEQQVVVKALPKYIKKVNGISGCTLLGDGSISLIIDVEALVDN